MTLSLKPSDSVRNGLRALACALLLCAVAALAAGADEARAQRTGATAQMQQLERIVRERVDSGRNTGIVAGMVFAGGRERTIAYGDGGAGRRLDEHSVMEIGSITKVFTGTLLADMARRGEVRLGDRVERLLPARVSVPERGGREITLEDLATHTSGLPSLPTNLQPKDPTNPYAGYGFAQLYEFLGGHQLARKPGATYAYSNVGVGLLGHALARRARMGYEQLVRERITEPLGMRSTAIKPSAAMARRFALGHDAGGAVTPYWDLPTLAGAGALRSSLNDMLRFAAANLARGGGSLKRAMATAQKPRRPAGEKLRIGLNWHAIRAGGRTIVWHDGQTGGFTSFIGIDRTRRTAIVVLSNSTAAGVADVGLEVLGRGR